MTTELFNIDISSFINQLKDSKTGLVAVGNEAKKTALATAQIGSEATNRSVNKTMNSLSDGFKRASAGARKLNISLKSVVNTLKTGGLYAGALMAAAGLATGGQAEDLTAARGTQIGAKTLEEARIAGDQADFSGLKQLLIDIKKGVQDPEKWAQLAQATGLSVQELQEKAGTDKGLWEIVKAMDKVANSLPTGEEMMLRAPEMKARFGQYFDDLMQLQGVDYKRVEEARKRAEELAEKAYSPERLELGRKASLMMEELKVAFLEAIVASGPLLVKLMDGIKAALPGLIKFVDAFVDLLSGKPDKLLTLLSDLFIGILKAIKDGVMGIFNELMDLIPGGKQAKQLAAQAAKVQEGVINTGKNIVHAVTNPVETFKKSWNSAINYFSSSPKPTTVKVINQNNVPGIDTNSRVVTRQPGVK